MQWVSDPLSIEEIKVSVDISKLVARISNLTPPLDAPSKCMKIIL